jgi:septal ring factor EnvC (AmiA/AmiB activator)
MTLEEFLTKFGNWLLAVSAAVVTYIAWRERTMTKVATLGDELKRVEGKIGELEKHLEQRRGQDVAIVTALAKIEAQLANLTGAVAEIKAELRHKQDKQP